MIKYRNDMYLIKAEDIKKRWQKYTEELYTRSLNDLANHNDVVTYLEPDILECEGKWTLRNSTKNKASGVDGIPAELFKSYKMLLLKCCTQYVSKFGKLISGHRTGQRSIFISIPNKGNAQECFNLLYNCTHFKC